MTFELKRSYLYQIRVRYKNSTKRQKSAILNEFCLVCGYSRKYAIRICSGQVQPRASRPGRKPDYAGVEFIHALVEIWKLTGRINSKMLKAAIPTWLPFLKDTSSSVKEKLLNVSAATIDRLLKPYKSKEKGRGLSSTRPSLLKNTIPLKLLEQSIVTTPGYVEVDTVAHCGESLAGEFVNTLTVTDLMSGWTENRALWSKTAEAVVKQLAQIESELPFDLVGLASDNGSEFINHELLKYLTTREAPINFVRRRPYKKNDNAHVEQKNYTHVRQLLGYERFDDVALVERINEIYRVYFNTLRNFFIPSMKLAKKERIGAKVKKKYETPKTPYQRLLESPLVPSKKKKILRQKFENLNPVFLARQLDKKLKELFELVDQSKRPQVGSLSSDT